MVAALSPSRTVITSFTPRRPSWSQCHGGSNSYASFEEGDWVICLACPSDGACSTTGLDSSSPFAAVSEPGTLACALSNGQILLYDRKTLHPVASFRQVHGSCLSSQLVYGPCGALLSAGMDGTLQVLDPRQGETAATPPAMLPSGQAALCVALGYDGYIAAVGSDKARVHFFDLRNMQRPLGSYVDAHTDAVTSLAFGHRSSPVLGPLLASGSEDGLVCVFDTRLPTEERALKTVLNVGAPVRRVGFCGDTGAPAGSSVVGGGGSPIANGQTLYCLTGSETASLWNFETALCVQDFGADLRQRLAALAPALPSLDYLVNAHWDAQGRDLRLTAGNARGGAAVFRLDASPVPPGPLQWELCHVLDGGHRGVVRDVCHLPGAMVVTAGEDARLCEWRRFQRPAPAAPAAPAAGVAHGAGDDWTPARHPHLVQAGPRSHGVPIDAMSAGGGGGGGPLRRPRQRQKCGPY